MTLNHKILTLVHTQVEGILWVELLEPNCKIIWDAMKYEVRSNINFQLESPIIKDCLTVIINDLKKKHGFYY